MESSKRIAKELERLEQERVRLEALKDVIESVEHTTLWHEEHWKTEESEGTKKYHADRYNAYRGILEALESMI